jgi:hypothetical protein
LQLEEKNTGLYVLLNQHYSRVVGLDLEPLSKGLRQVGFRSYGKYRDFRIFFEEVNSQAFFDAFLAWLKGVVEQLVALEKAE